MLANKVSKSKEDIIIKKNAPLFAKTEIKGHRNNNDCLNDSKRITHSTRENNESIDFLDQRQEKFYGSDKEKKVAKLLKENEDLRSQNKKFKTQIKDKETIVNDLMALNMDLQKQVISEYTEISKINKEIQTKVLSNFDELLHVVSEYF